ncbi:MAG: hypothetical protein DCF15_11665 [Phormidesmis priestleyi]|uniref:Uncharacterized protein n=1 Tax=Phormidesmis priestleyi TaxID=268141 RepID=A0A2W4ZHR4_9CYAN|nr:MAG: hypothetical protein DCF15_11665 [Phormidesmis priestleyi]
MDISLLVSLLAPCLPGLMGLGKAVGKKAVETAAETAAEKVGEQSAVQAGKIWQRLWPKVKAKAAAKEAAEDVAKDPNDADSVAALRGQLKKILEGDQALAAEVAALLKAAEIDGQGTWIQQSVTGDRNQVIGTMGGNAKAIGSVTGDVTM